MGTQTWNFTAAPFDNGELLSSTEHDWTTRPFPATFQPVISANKAVFPNVGSGNPVLKNAGSGSVTVDVAIDHGAAYGFQSQPGCFVLMDMASGNGYVLMLLDAQNIWIQRIDNWSGTAIKTVALSTAITAADTSIGLRFDAATNKLWARRNDADIPASDVTIAQYVTQTFAGCGNTFGGPCHVTSVTMTGANFGASAGITLTDQINHRVYQRAAGSDAAEITIAGSYTGVPGAIEYRIFDVTTGAALAGHDWQTLLANPAGGVFSATRNIPSGGPYRTDVRAANAPAVSVSGTAQWFVGDVLVIAGQSNADGLRNGTSPVAAHPRVRLLDGDNSCKTLLASNGAGLVALANKCRALTGKPVGVMVRAAAATSIGQWQPGGGGNLPQLLADIQTATATPSKTGGDIAAFLWCQGEADTGLGSTYNAPAAYKTALDTLYAAVRTQVGRSAAQLPFLLAVTGRNEGASGNDAGWQNIRQAQIEWCAATSGAVLSHMTYDLPMADALHYSMPAGFQEHGARFGRSAAKALGAAVYGAEGPKITSATRQGAVITVTTALHGSAALQQGGSGALTAWQVTNNDFASLLPIASVALSGADQILMTLASTPAATDVVKVRYAYGQDPDTANLVVGDAA